MVGWLRGKSSLPHRSNDDVGLQEGRWKGTNGVKWLHILVAKSHPGYVLVATDACPGSVMCDVKWREREGGGEIGGGVVLEMWMCVCKKPMPDSERGPEAEHPPSLPFFSTSSTTYLLTLLSKKLRKTFSQLSAVTLSSAPPKLPASSSPKSCPIVTSKCGGMSMRCAQS